MIMRKPLATIVVFCSLFLGATLAAADDLAQVRQAIRDKGLRWTAGPAQFTEQEVRARLGVPLPLSHSLGFCTAAKSPPASWDWRTQNAVSGVRDQGSCGSCWAFASVECLESAAIRQGGYPASIDLSEQDLISCYSGGGSCSEGSNLDGPAKYLATTGIVDETCFPYGEESWQSGEPVESCSLCSNWQADLYIVGNHGTVTQDVDDLKTAVYTNGPLAVSFKVFEDFEYYKSGVYSYAYGPVEGGHAVLIVGYNDDGGYFIVKNSWGASWGMNGYFEIAYGEVAGITDFGADAQWMGFGSGPAALACNSSSCPNGCCDAYGCETGADNAACGTGGNPCAACSGSGEVCDPTQKSCVACAANSCPSGCCDAFGCETGAGDSTCGAGGNACVDCAVSGRTCNSHSCVACDSTSCPNGCCDVNGCEPGGANGACGSGGNACVDCAASGQTCAANGCSPTSWSEMTSGATADTTLRSVWGSSPSDVFAAGYEVNYAANTLAAAILHYDGSSWSTTASVTAATAYMNGVWGNSSSDVFAVGRTSSFAAIILHYDGSSWTTMASGASGFAALAGVWGSSSSDVFAVGEEYAESGGGIAAGANLILHYNGASWSAAPCGTATAYLNGVWGSSASNVFAVGVMNTSSLTAVILHYDGSSWSAMPNGSPGYAELRGVWGISPTDVFAVGSGYEASGSSYIPTGNVILHYDGASWSTLANGSTTALYGVWGSSATNVLAAGFLMANGAPAILSYDGSSWPAMAITPVAPGILYGIWGSSSADVFAVGAYGAILHYSASPDDDDDNDDNDSAADDDAVDDDSSPAGRTGQSEQPSGCGC